MIDGLETEERGRSTEHWFVLFGALMIPVVMALMAIWFTPDERGFGTHEQLGIQPCITLELWGVPCPGCGVTTSVTLAAQGKLLDSFLAQPLGFLLAIGGLLFTFWSLWLTLRGRDLYVTIMELPFAKLWRPLVLVVLVSWIYKWIRTVST